MSIFSDALDAIGSVGEGLVDDIESIPGVGDLVSSALDDLKAFANTPLGQIFLTVCAPGVVNILWSVPLVGPVVADVGWCLPGLAKGEKLSTAAAETITRYVNAAGAGDVGSEASKEFSDQFPDAASEWEGFARDAGKIAGQIPTDPSTIVNAIGEKFGLSVPVDENDLVTAFAQKLGMREDFARLALDQVLGLVSPDPKGLYDPDTGRRLIPTAKEIADQQLRSQTSTLVHGLSLKQSVAFDPLKATSSRSQVLLGGGPSTQNTLAVATIVQAQHPDASAIKSNAAAALAHDAVSGRPGALEQAIATGDPVAATALLVKARLVKRRAFVDRYTHWKQTQAGIG